MLARSITLISGKLSAEINVFKFAENMTEGEHQNRAVSDISTDPEGNEIVFVIHLVTYFVSIPSKSENKSSMLNTSVIYRELMFDLELGTHVGSKHNFNLR